MDSSAKPTVQQSLRTKRIQHPSSSAEHTSQSIRPQHSFSSQHASPKPVNMMQSIRTHQSSSSTLTSQSLRHQQSSSSIFPSQHDSSKSSQSLRCQQSSSSVFPSQHDSSKISQSFPSQHDSSKISQLLRCQQSSSSVFLSQHDSSKTSQSLRHQQSSSSVFPSQHDSSKTLRSLRRQQSSSFVFPSQHDSSKISQSFLSQHDSSKTSQSIRHQQSSSSMFPPSQHDSSKTSQSLRRQQSSSSMFSTQYDSSKPVNMMQSIRTQQSSPSRLTSQSFRRQQSSSSMFSSEHRSSKPLSTTQSIRTQHSSFSGHASQCLSTHQSSSSENVSFRKLVLPNHLHRHALTLTAAGAPYSCNGCKEAGFGRSYRCENKGCSYVLHEECANAVLQCKNPVSHSFFKEEKFWFLEKPLGYPRVCDACRMDVLGFVYHRYDNGHPDDTGLDLHPCCLKLRDNVSYRDLDETKTLRLHRNVPKKCVRCKSRKVGDDSKVKGWSYLTSDGDCYHVSCFKELFLEKLRDDCFSEKKIIVVSKMQSNVVESNNMKVVKVGEGSNNSKESSSVAKKMVGKIAPVVLKLIFSAIFGDPVSFVLALVEALATSIN